VVRYDSGCSTRRYYAETGMHPKRSRRNEALRLKQQFEAIGAEIELVALEKAPVAAADEDEVDEDAETNVRTLSDSEYIPGP